jgi:hypothetical protein
MSRLGYVCRSCRYFRENISNSVTRHILAAKESLCEMEQDPFGSFLCQHYAPLEGETKNGRRVIAKHKEVRNVANY